MTQEPKLWKDMTPEEKGALLLADHEGKVIEWNSTHAFTGEWGEWEACDEDCLWDGEWGGDGFAYRVKPNREKVTARICLTAQGASMYMESARDIPSQKDHLCATLTFDVIDGNPDPASLKIEEVG
jgi:hypothetical protein